MQNLNIKKLNNEIEGQDIIFEKSNDKIIEKKDFYMSKFLPNKNVIEKDKIQNLRKELF